MSFLDQCSDQILDHAGPFRRLSDAARAGLADYLKRKPAGQSQSREEMFAGEIDKGRAEFFWTLGFVGMFACEHARERIAYDATMDRVPSFKLELSDLLYSEAIVATKKTVACPDSGG